MTTPGVVQEKVLPDAEGFVPNGYVDTYPHDDFEHPCTNQCCEPDDDSKPNVWTCEVWPCVARLRHPGACINCVP